MDVNHYFYWGFPLGSIFKNLPFLLPFAQNKHKLVSTIMYLKINYTHISLIPILRCQTNSHGTFLFTYAVFSPASCTTAVSCQIMYWLYFAIETGLSFGVFCTPGPWGLRLPLVELGIEAFSPFGILQEGKIYFK